MIRERRVGREPGGRTGGGKETIEPDEMSSTANDGRPGGTDRREGGGYGGRGGGGGGGVQGVGIL